MTRMPLLALAALCIVPLMLGVARAQTVESSISGRFLSGSDGAFGFNEASGAQNLQFNATAVAVSSGNIAIATVEAFQFADPVSLDDPLHATAVISDRAFSDIEGIISVNQAAGGGNLQANGIAIAVGSDPQIVADSLLSQSLAIRPELNPSEEESLEGDTLSASIKDSAFRDTAGIVQLNQAAGVNNATRNLFALRVAADVNP